MTEQLLRLGNQVIGVDNLSAGRKAFMEGAMGQEGFSFVEGDMVNMDLKHLLMGVDVVCHFAANPDVRLGASNTRVHFEQNIEVTYRLLRSAPEARSWT
jgi:UDP-glucose 4-epimerase